MKCTDPPKGSITLVFALTVTTILAVVFTALGLARRHADHAEAVRQTQAASESVFAAYYAPLWENYHLFFMADSVGPEQLMEAYLKECRSELSASSTSMTQAERAMDDGYTSFLEEVQADMEGHGISELVSELIPKEGLIRDVNRIAGTLKKLSKLADAAAAVQNDISGIVQRGQKLKRDFSALNDYLREPSWSKETADALLSQIQREAAEMAGENEGASHELSEHAEKLFEDDPEEESEEGQIENKVLSDFSGKTEKNMELFQEDRKKVNQAKETAQEMSGLLKEIEGLPPAPENDAERSRWEQTVKELMARLEALPSADDKDVQTFPASDGDSPGGRLVKAIKKWKDYGITGLVLPEGTKVSERALSGVLVSSSFSGKEKTDQKNSDHALSGALLGSYAGKHFQSFTDENPGKILSYEMEYILNGKKNDRENLENTIRKLFALRAGCNLFFLLQNPEKKAEAEGMAAAITAAAASPVLTDVTKSLILCGWSMAEAVLDVKTLCANGTIPLLKGPGDWKTSLAEAADVLGGRGAASSAGKKGLSYKQYLEVLLLPMKKGDKVLRIMDLVQTDLRRNDPGFWMENCIHGAEFETKYRSQGAEFTVKSQYRYNKAR